MINIDYEGPVCNFICLTTVAQPAEWITVNSRGNFAYSCDVCKQALEANGVSVWKFYPTYDPN